MPMTVFTTATYTPGVTDHGGLTGRADDSKGHTIYPAIAGRAGGQILAGGTNAADTLTLAGTTNVGGGDILFEPAQGTTVSRFLSTGEFLVNAAALYGSEQMRVDGAAHVIGDFYAGDWTGAEVPSRDFHFLATNPASAFRLDAFEAPNFGNTFFDLSFVGVNNNPRIYAADSVNRGLILDFDAGGVALAELTIRSPATHSTGRLDICDTTAAAHNAELIVNGAGAGTGTHSFVQLRQRPANGYVELRYDDPGTPTVRTTGALPLALGTNSFDRMTVLATGEVLVNSTVVSAFGEQFRVEGDTYLNGEVRMDVTNPALGGGALATLGTVGGAGPAAAGQNSWVQVTIGGVTGFIPFWT